MNNPKDLIDLTQDEAMDLTQDSDEGENSNSRAPHPSQPRTSLPASRPGAVRTNSTRTPRRDFPWARTRGHAMPPNYRPPVEQDNFTPQQSVHKCSDCMDTFPSRELLQEHLRDAHGREPLAWLQNPVPMHDHISCPLGCPEKFINQVVLDRHLIEAHGHKDPDANDDDSEFVNGRKQKDRTGQVRYPYNTYQKNKAKKEWNPSPQ